jgi:hypothetical protein
MQAGDLIGVRAACFSGCGELSVEFSMDGGATLVVSAPTVETDEWGTTLAFWCAVPSGLSPGRHEVRARIKPSVCGWERILQGNTTISPSDLTSSFAVAKSSLVIVKDVASPVFTVVKVGGLLTAGNEGTHASGLKSGAVGSLASYPLSECYSHIGWAAYALREHMGVGALANHGATIYVGEGDWNANTTYTPDNLWWLTVRRHPDAAKASTRLMAENAVGPSSASSAWVKYQGFQIRLDTGPGSVLYAASGSNCYWFDDCDIIGGGQEEGSYGLVSNNTNKWKWITNLNQTGVRSSGIAGGVIAMVRNAHLVDCTSDILTGIAVSVGGTARNHRGLGWLNGVNVDEHGDLFQQPNAATDIEGLIIADWDVECVTLRTVENFNWDVGMSMFQGVPLADIPVGESDNTLCENVRMVGLSGGGGQMTLWGRVGSMLRNVTCSNRLAGLHEDIPFDSNEVVNCIFSSSEAAGTDFYSRIKTNGNYEGNHNISGTAADVSDTTGTPDWGEDGVPVEGGNLAGRTRFILADAASGLRAVSDYAGALSTFFAPVSSPPGGIYRTSRTVTLSNSGGITYYTLDGVTEPDATDTLYTAPIPLTADVTIKSVRVQGSQTSGVKTEVYTVVTDGGSIPPRSQAVSIAPPSHLA